MKPSGRDWTRVGPQSKSQTSLMILQDHWGASRDHGSGWHMCLLCPLACERDLNPLPHFFHTPSRPRAKQTSNIKTSDCDLGFHPPPLPSLKEDSIASTICRKGPRTILLPLQEALNNYINLPKYGKKIPLQIREAWHAFWLHTGCLARPAVLLGAYCHSECFL